MFGLRAPIPLLAVAVLLVAPAEATTSYYVGATNEASFLESATPRDTSGWVPGSRAAHSQECFTARTVMSTS